MLKEIHLSHFPPDLALFVTQYKDVENAAFLRDQLIAGNQEFEYAFLDASMILSTSHVLAAAFRAINDCLSQRLKSRNVHSEVVFCLSPNNNIAESFRKFGISDTTKDLIAVKVATSPEITFNSVQAHLGSVIKGTPVEFADENITAVSDVPNIKKVYKLSNLGVESSKKGNGSIMDGEAVLATLDRDLESAILGTMAIRGAT